jgi:hypothetical protein
VIDSKNLMAVVASWLVIGTASIHLENLSTVTNRYVCPPRYDLGRGPTWSSPHCVKGHARGIVRSSDAGAWGFVAKCRHTSHRLMMFLASWSADSQ